MYNMFNFFSIIAISLLLLQTTGFVRGYKQIIHRNRSVFVLNNVKKKALAIQYTPKGFNQNLYVEYLEDPKAYIVLGVGPAGTGKTLFACNYAVNQLIKGNIQKIILTRPVVCVEEELGFLPGDIISKMDPYTRPLFDILQETFSKKDIDSMIHSGTIEISPLAFMRGRTFKDAFIIADEMQNSSPNQMLMLTSRIGSGSRMVITGDLKQSDRGDNNGLADFMKKIKSYNKWVFNKHDSPFVVDFMTRSIRFVEFNSTDIMRSYITSKVLDIYSNTYNIDDTSIEKVIENDCALIPKIWYGPLPIPTTQHSSKSFLDTNL